jgi:hypothetical protein
VGRLPGEPCLLDQMRGDRAVDNTQHLPHDLWAAVLGKFGAYPAGQSLPKSGAPES